MSYETMRAPTWTYSVAKANSLAPTLHSWRLAPNPSDFSQSRGSPGLFLHHSLETCWSLKQKLQLLCPPATTLPTCYLQYIFILNRFLSVLVQGAHTMSETRTDLAEEGRRDSTVSARSKSEAGRKATFPLQSLLRFLKSQAFPSMLLCKTGRLEQDF